MSQLYKLQKLSQLKVQQPPFLTVIRLSPFAIFFIHGLESIVSTLLWRCNHCGYYQAFLCVVKKTNPKQEIEMRDTIRYPEESSNPTSLCDKLKINVYHYDHQADFFLQSMKVDYFLRWISKAVNIHSLIRVTLYQYRGLHCSTLYIVTRLFD